MSAVLLRAAAEKIRQNSEDATRGPWVSVEIEDEDGRKDSYVYALTGLSSIGEDVGEGMAGADAQHIASWPPEVALAVADWLANTALAVEKGYAAPREREDALAVARAYLKSDT